MTPVAAAVLPLKEAAIERAEQESKAWVARAYADLEAVGWNLDKIVPYPRSSDPAFKSKLIRRSMYDAVTTWTQPTRRPGEPNIVRADERKAAQFVQISKEDASAHYDSFVAKLEDKIGEHVSASLTGNHVWSFSILVVTKTDGSVCKWKTTQIVNVSKHGRLFNQWPSRKVK